MLITSASVVSAFLVFGLYTNYANNAAKTKT